MYLLGFKHFMLPAELLTGRHFQMLHCSPSIDHMVLWRCYSLCSFYAEFLSSTNTTIWQVVVGECAFSHHKISLNKLLTHNCLFKLSFGDEQQVTGL